ncbi:hypothetical protein TNCV_521441 [Trichonephila clavipes]|nr:hypothetical protein TNCV_521441 [Trichonephila clavipes]
MLSGISLFPRVTFATFDYSTDEIFQRLITLEAERGKGVVSFHGCSEVSNFSQGKASYLEPVQSEDRKKAEKMTEDLSLIEKRIEILENTYLKEE